MRAAGTLGGNIRRRVVVNPLQCRDGRPPTGWEAAALSATPACELLVSWRRELQQQKEAMICPRQQK
jgi:hypothetical protein